ncbi:hypothetical protein FRC08_015340 [Ceratobasidium sp. 394]|nr:hypothetical protein FRC08_015340 [Ceratobasidium sp. 394]
MSEEHQNAFNNFSQTIDVTLIHHWEAMRTEPELRNGQWRSVFTLPEPTAMSVSAKIKQIELLESQTTPGVLHSHVPGLASWVASALDILAKQKWLHADVTPAGSSPTAVQALELPTGRKAILAELQHHHDQASKFLPTVFADAAAGPHGSSDGQPENLKTQLPSDLSSHQLAAIQDSPIVDTEKELLHASCLKHLQSVRSVTVQRVHNSSLHMKHACGQAMLTRAQTQQTRLQDCLETAQWMYNNLHDRLHRLGMTAQDSQTFKMLTTQDLKMLQKDVGKIRPLGGGHVQLLWYWRVDLSSRPQDADSVSVPVHEVHTEYNNSLRVEWF